jgi:hypothetical protein
MKLTALLAQERREGIEQGREEGVNIFYSSSLRCKKKNPHKLLISGLWGFFAIIPIQWWKVVCS